MVQKHYWTHGKAICQHVYSLTIVKPFILSKPVLTVKDLDLCCSLFLTIDILTGDVCQYNISTMPQCQVKFNVLWDTEVQENGFILRFVCLILLLLIVLKRNKIMLKKKTFKGFNCSQTLNYFVVCINVKISATDREIHHILLLCQDPFTLNPCGNSTAQHTLLPIRNYFMFFIWYFSFVFRWYAHDPLKEWSFLLLTNMFLYTLN